jgi:integrase
MRKGPKAGQHSMGISKPELRLLFQQAQAHNTLYYRALVTAYWHGLRVSELTALCGSDVTLSGEIIIRRLKGSRTTTQVIQKHPDPLFDESPLLELAKERGTRKLFPITPRHFNRLIKLYGRQAGIHESKLFMHNLKHSCALLVWERTQSLGELQSYLGHVSPTSSLIYLAVAHTQRVQSSFTGVEF